MRYLQFTLSRMMLPILTVCIGVASPCWSATPRTRLAGAEGSDRRRMYQFITGADGYVPNGGNSVVIVNDGMTY